MENTEGSKRVETIASMCQISCEEVAPSEFIEYQFEAPCDEWRLACVTRDSLDCYIDAKFQVEFSCIIQIRV